MTKKEKILDTALTLFSEKGFDAVGVDAIGEAVGLKGPALYHYFKGKEDILNELLNTIELHYIQHFIEGELPEDVNSFIQMSLDRLKFTLTDPWVAKARKLITMEQYRNDTFARLATKHFIEENAKVNYQIISHLIENGSLIPMNPKVMAFEFTAPVTVLISLLDRQPDQFDLVMKSAKAHMEHFKNMYSKGGK